MLGMYFRNNKQLKEFVGAYKLKHGYGILLSKNEKSRVRYEGCPWKVSEGMMQNFCISAYMILIHVVGLSIASKFLQIGWQKSRDRPMLGQWGAIAPPPPPSEKK